MAEIVGTIASAITLASIFKACLNAFDLFHTVQHADLDVKRLLVRLNIERCRLYTWGEAMGVTKALKSKEKSVLDNSPFMELVRDTLEAMEQLFQDSAKIETRYGCKQVKKPFSRRKPTDLIGSNPMDDLAASFSNFYVPGTSNMPPPSQQTKALSKVRWAIHDQKKFNGLIRELKELVDGLQNITESIFTTSRQGGMLRFGIQQIKNSDTLEIVSAACEIDYPDISEAATVKLDVMTVGTCQRDDILDWLNEEKSAGEEMSMMIGPHPHLQPHGEGMSDLNELVAKYLRKKSYTDTLAILVAESWAVDGKKAQVQPASESTGLKRKGDAAQMAIHPETTMFRRFSALSARDLLYFQAELVMLEKDLRSQQLTDSMGSDTRKHQYDTRQLELVKKIRETLRLYNKALIQHSQIQVYLDLESWDISCIQSFLHTKDIGPLALRGLNPTV